MNLVNAILVGLKEIWSHKFRSILTMLGIILGVASLVAMAAMVKGMENGLKETMVAMGGADKVLLDQQPVPAYQEDRADEAPGRTMADVRPCGRAPPDAAGVSGNGVGRRQRHRSPTRTRLHRPSECVGVWPAVLDMNLHTLEYGRFFH